MRSEVDCRQSLDLQLQDFTPDDEAKDHWSDLNAGKPAKVTNKPATYIVFIIFVKLKNYDFLGCREKVAWEIPVKYKSIPMLLTHRKFGFSIRTYTGTPEHEKLAQEAIHKINKAIPKAEKLMAEEINELVSAGEVALINEHTFLWARYEYFRGKANEHLTKEASGYSSFDTEIKANMALRDQNLNFDLLKGKAASYISAMVDAYFSLLEHILVLLRPFVNSSGIYSNLSNFIGRDWGDKYKILFDMSSKNVKKQFDTLREIKEVYRNPLAHGNFQKKGGSLYVQLPTLGYIPMNLTAGSNKDTQFSFYNFREIELKRMCSSFDEFDEFLCNGPARYGMMYIKSGLNVFYNSEHTKDYKEAMVSDEKFSQLIDRIKQEQNDSRNMDW